MTRPQTATWNREDRDLLIELKTQMMNMSGDIAAARLEIKEINTGITGRLLNLEGNSVSKIEVNPRLDSFNSRITDLEDDRIALRAQVKTWGAVGALAFTAVQLFISVYFR